MNEELDIILGVALGGNVYASATTTSGLGGGFFSRKKIPKEWSDTLGRYDVVKHTN